MQDEINEKSITLAVRLGKLTATELKKAIERILAEQAKAQEKAAREKSEKTEKSDNKRELKQGKQTLKQLQKQNDGLSTVELKDPNLRLLYSEMKKHGVDFAAVKDGKGKYTLFFKSKDADSITHAFNKYSQKLLNRSNGLSIGKALAAAKEIAKKLNAGLDKVKNRSKGERGR